MEINKKPTESVKEYKIRICSNKEIYNLSYPQIANLINNVTGDTKGESAYRKWWVAYREGLEDAKKQFIDNDALLQEYEEKRIEFEKAKIKYSDQRTSYMRNIRNETRFDELKEIVENSLSNMDTYSYSKTTIRDSDNDLLIGLNDIHFGANIDNHWNKYNSDIAKIRLEKYLDNIIKIKSRHNSENCYVCANGDLISGNIHYTIQIANKENIVAQVMGVSELISWFLSELSKHFNKVNFSVVAGNHSRVSTKDNSPKDERLDDLIPWYVKARLNNVKNIYVADNTSDNTFNIIDIRGLKYINIHGDYDNSSSLHKILGMIDENIYCIHMGHLHHNRTDNVQKQKVIMSGSLQGMDDYCVEKRIYGKAQQLVCVCTEDGIECSYDIDLQVNGYEK